VTITQAKFNFVDVFGKRARRQIQQGTAANRIALIYRASAAFASRSAERAGRQHICRSAGMTVGLR
jgi:hypothetical protein